MANWVTPKTDWVATDYFNIEDYNRIVGNLIYLQLLALDLFVGFDLEEMEEEKRYASLIYAEEMNVIEENLEIINNNTYGFDIGDSQTFTANGSTPLWSEFNRIESAQLRIFYAIYGQSIILPHLEIHLGRKNWGKRVKYSKDEINDYRLSYKLGSEKGSLRV